MATLQTQITSLEALITKANALPSEKKIQSTKTTTPTKSVQTVSPDSGYDGLAGVTVEAIPSKYQDVSGVTATASGTLSGQKFVNSSGTVVTGTMPNNGSTSKTINGLETKFVTIPEGYTTGGTVTVDDTVDNIADTQANLLEQIQSALQGKSVPGGDSSGENIETCTVTVIESSNTYCHCFYSSYKDGVQSYNYAKPRMGEYILTDVICGSLITVLYSTTVPYIELDEGMEKILDWHYIISSTSGCGISAPKTAGVTGTITLINDI